MRDEHGFIAVQWMFGVTTILLPVVLLVGSIAPWFERANMAQVMAQEAGRAMVLADNWDAGLVEATRITHEVAANYGFTETDWCEGSGCLSMTISGTAPGQLARRTKVQVIVAVPIPGLVVPFIGSVGEFRWETDHVEQVDNYRSFSR